MIDQDRVREMTKLAAYEKRDGKRYYQVTRYFRSDFVGRHLLKGFLCGTVCFGVFLLLWGVYYMEELVKNLDHMDLIQFGIAVLVRYLFFMIAYLVVVDIYANVYYAAGKRHMKRYYRRLKRLDRMYEDEEGRQIPTRH